MGNNFFKIIRYRYDLSLKRRGSEAEESGDGENWYSRGRVSHSEFRIVLVGSGGVGKSAITLQYISRKYISDYDPTIEDSFRKQVAFEDRVCILDILDTAGQEEYKALRHQWLRDREGVILVFSLDNRKSFEDLVTWFSSIFNVKENESNSGPIILVLNKVDLRGTSECEITDEEIKEFRDKLPHPIRYVETSAKTRTNIDNLFQQIVEECVVYREKWNIPTLQKQLQKLD
eukprot:TRINITY_DN17871_c0_g1_i1.p1 TRINITY_DN17871_c0_g1~~TRINITY_DN17871_c0_g1_i1.p1  ORF type:complete len:231 (+),score=28.66 TRINITY_DN17871_c0_g1_i1:388-1080(+)